MTRILKNFQFLQKLLDKRLWAWGMDGCANKHLQDNYYRREWKGNQLPEQRRVRNSYIVYGAYARNSELTEQWANSKRSAVSMSVSVSVWVAVHLRSTVAIIWQPQLMHSRDLHEGGCSSAFHRTSKPDWQHKSGLRWLKTADMRFWFTAWSEFEFEFRAQQPTKSRSKVRPLFLQFRVTAALVCAENHKWPRGRNSWVPAIKYTFIPCESWFCNIRYIYIYSIRSLRATEWLLRQNSKL